MSCCGLYKRLTAVPLYDTTEHRTQGPFVKVSQHGDSDAAPVVSFYAQGEAVAKTIYGTGKSSFDLVDSARLFEELHLEPGSVFADLGCGRGEYAVQAALRVGEQGTVYAVDLWEEGLVVLGTEAEFLGLHQLKVVATDICARLPIEDQSVDVCFVATVLHDYVREGCSDGVLDAARRIVRQGGTLAVVEFKKFDGHPGPSIQVKLSPEEVERIVTPHGFTMRRFVDLGQYTYLILFSPLGAPAPGP
jgi:ubiquinone/menaquinone biosynthesis C-methylase UbiE